jgi:hypothetical protein
MKRFALLALAALIATSATAQQTDPKGTKPAGAESKATAPDKDRRMGLAKPIVMTKEREVYGAELTLKENTKLSEIAKNPKAFEGKKVRVTGAIGDVCQKKGCFMYLSEGDMKTQVKFTGYAFFVPLDVEGRTATVEGTPKVKVLTEGMRRHYAEDRGLPKEEIEKIKGDETVVMLEVDAVEITGAAKPAAPVESKPAKKEG